MFEHGEAGSDLIEALDALHSRISHAQRELLRLIAEVDRCGRWEDEGARDAAHWLVMRYGVSYWKAQRWIAAAQALEGLPRLSEALARGELGIDKVVELTRLATPETEVGLIRWATRVSCGAIRHRGDLAARTRVEDVLEPERDRSLSWCTSTRDGGSVLRPSSRPPRERWWPGCSSGWPRRSRRCPRRRTRTSPRPGVPMPSWGSARHGSRPTPTPIERR